MAKVIREELIRQLASGSFISGQQLGEQLGVSRAAISKHMRAISDMGLDVFCVTGKGYKLAKPLDLLSKSKITYRLGENSEPNKR